MIARNIFVPRLGCEISLVILFVELNSRNSIASVIKYDSINYSGIDRFCVFSFESIVELSEDVLALVNLLGNDTEGRDYLNKLTNVFT